MPPPPPKKGDTASATGKEENIYIPSFISKKPFYAGEDDDENDYLRHQRLQKQQDDSQRYDRGKKAGPAATKYRKGACENCGAMGHKVRDCLSRPRARGAKYTGKDIQADEVKQDIKLGWDAKRDRWSGYDPREYKAVVEGYNQMEELRRKALQKSGGEAGEAQNDDNGGGGGGGGDDGDKYAEENDMSKHQSTATRQLRIREDTAKYLLNLDLDSAKYDPKTRALVDGGATIDKAAEVYAEEGFLKASGDAEAFESAQRYAWEAQELKGDTSQHLQANPTAGEVLRKKEKEEAERKKAERQRALKEMYGEQEEAPAALREMAVTESETYVEYDEYGLVKGAPRKIARSKYQEDVLVNNHTTVWGSWWNNFTWGYECCHSQIKNSYCTGEDGKRAWEASERQRTGGGLEAGDEAEEVQHAARERSPLTKDDPEKGGESRKRGVGEMLGGVTDADMDEYRRKRAAADDPMAKLLGKDELVH